MGTELKKDHIQIMIVSDPILNSTYTYLYYVIRLDNIDIIIDRELNGFLAAS